MISTARVTNLCVLMDDTYCSFDQQEHCRGLGHVPLIDYNLRGGEKDEVAPGDAIHYCERTVAEHVNGRL